ncbi:hypothetical protein N7520_009945 [Penicillium odoratum]|uniref:uncharacterized protein n=1 Tax=Penicillium odoratum TaxID=1167516 RepID=UPI002547114B|nr:uncharacterized protein N7520_009945 [Penicillium odoratum]KAJ5753028.1 hypothetical protein N7520_009945 [Penicillium odoratum]
MSLSKITGLILGSAALVAGHGYVSGIVVDDTYYGGYIITEYPYESDPPELIAWSEDETDLGYIDGSEYANSNIICHKDAKAAALEAPVKAGGSVELQWTTWPSSHHGPVITYMANCNGDCADVDKTTLEFFKIDQGGLISDTDVPGTWATDNLISNNNSRTVTVPSDIADGNYVLRHEIIALHSAEETNGAQNYPQCINLKVTGGGSATPSGTLGTALYKNTDPGILINIYTSLSTYEIPGPTLYTAAATTASTAVSTTAVATTSAEVTSTPASVESVVPTTTLIASVSASPTRSPSFTPPFSNSTRAWRPSFSRQPSSPSFTSAPAQFTAPSAAEQHQSATATPTVITLTETSTSWVTELVTLTDKSVVQTTSAVPVAVAVTTTVTEGSEPTQTSSASVASGSTSGSGSGSGSGSESSGSGSGSTSSSSSSTSTESDYVSSDWTSYLSSLSASEVLQLLRQTFKWLVSNDKVHARDISISN